MQYSFTWNGTNSREMGIRLQSMPEIVRPEERVNHVVIPGRAGELTEVEGDDIYNSYIQTVPVTVQASQLSAVEKWLRGDGYVTFSSQPTLKQRARVINAASFAKHGRNSSWWDGEIQFYCYPLKEALSEAAVEITASGTTVTNPGDVVSHPRFTLTGTGTITIRIGEKSITVYAPESGWKVDSDTEWVTDQYGTPQINAYNGSFPVFEPGENTVQFSGEVTKITIEGRWRYL